MKKQTIFNLASMPKMVLIVTLIVMLGLLFGAVSYLLKTPKIDLPIVNPVVEDQCEIDSDCYLVYVTDNDYVCQPCDKSSEKYQCLTVNEMKKLKNKGNKIDESVLCSPCSSEFDKYICKCEDGKCEKVKEEAKKDNQNNYFINKELGIKFNYSSIGFKEKLIVENNQVVYRYPNSNNIKYISLFTKKNDQTIEDAILDIIKNEGKNPKDCKVVKEEKYFRDPDYQAYSLDLTNPIIVYSKQELERIKSADIEAEQDSGPFNGEHQKQVIRNERLIKACSYYADPLGLGTSSTIPSRFIYNNKNKFVFLPGLADAPFYQEDFIELFDDNYQDEEVSDTSNWQTYQNKEFGFEFKYPKDKEVEQINNKFYLDGLKGQSVEIFRKSKKDSLNEAIEKEFLNNYPEEDCFVQSLVISEKQNYPSSYLKSAIFYQDKNGEPGWMTNYGECPINYSTTNGVSYFLVDKNNFDRYAYFSIGQYAIMINEGNSSADTKWVSWQSTFKFMEKEEIK